MIYINYKENVMKSGRARRLLLLLLLRTFGWELPDIGSYQEVYHRATQHYYSLFSDTFCIRDFMSYQFPILHDAQTAHEIHRFHSTDCIGDVSRYVY